MTIYENPIDARKAGYHAMTNPYCMPSESWMMQNTIEDMKAIEADFCVVLMERKANGTELFEIWRK